VGYHTLFGAPSQWTPAVGKTCPGTVRIRQWHEQVVPRILGTLVQEDLTMADAQDILDALDKHSQLIRVGDQQGGTVDTHDFSSLEGIGRQVKALDAKVGTLGEKVDALIELLGPVPPA
jgi:energy-converting hydrogenase A subunit M